MDSWMIVAGVLVGFAAAMLIGELIPAAPSLQAALGRLDETPARPLAPSHYRLLSARALARRFRALVPWMPVPVTDLELLGQGADQWLASKVALGLAGLVVFPCAIAALSLDGISLPWGFPVLVSIALATALFLAPDLVTRVNAAERRRDFRYALMSYLDLVTLERGAGAAPTEALEGAASVGRGWAFKRIAEALDEAGKAGRPPWDGLARLAEQIGVTELADLAEIAGIAGNEGARILDTLTARAESMRADALARMKAQAGARGTTMVLPISLLAAGFLILLIFPDFYRVFG